MEIKERFKEILEREKLTRINFETKVGITGLSHLLSGRNKPSLEVLQKIQKAFPAISMDWLVSGIGSIYGESIESIKKQENGSSNPSSDPKMGSLFPPELKKEIEYGKENDLTPPSPVAGHPIPITVTIDQSPQTQSDFGSTRTKPIEDTILQKKSNDVPHQQIIETTAVLSTKRIRKMIVCYSDNTYEEYKMQLCKEE